MEGSRSNRWLIAAAGVVMQIALGAVYAWSVFRIPLTTTYGWTIRAQPHSHQPIRRAPSAWSRYLRSRTYS
jgi:hypothetical protein